MSNPDLQFRILGQRIRVHCDDALFRDLALANYAAFEQPGDTADIEYSVTREDAGGFRITRGEETLAEVNNDDALRYEFVYLLEKLLTIDLQHRRTDLFFVHAAALARNGRVIMISAESGTGKSTTAWALLGSGFHYLSDELAPIDPVTREVHPYPHALCLKAPPPGPYPLPDATVQTERTLHIPVTELPCALTAQPERLAALVFLRREAGASAPTVAQVSPAEAGARLYANTLNVLAHPGYGLDTAISIAGAVPAFLVNAGDLQATCELISSIEERL